MVWCEFDCLKGNGEDCCSHVKLTSCQSCVRYVTRLHHKVIPRKIHEADLWLRSTSPPRLFAVEVRVHTQIRTCVICVEVAVGQ